MVIDHGAGIVATGGDAYTPTEYNFDSITGVVTSVQFDKLFELKEKQSSKPGDLSSSNV